MDKLLKWIKESRAEPLSDPDYGDIGYWDIGYDSLIDIVELHINKYKDCTKKEIINKSMQLRYFVSLEYFEENEAELDWIAGFGAAIEDLQGVMGLDDSEMELKESMNNTEIEMLLKVRNVTLSVGIEEWIKRKKEKCKASIQL
jgi:hypothetical protein